MGWFKMAGETAKESVFASRVLFDLMRACNSNDQSQKAEVYLEKARESIVAAVGEDNPVICDYYFAKIEYLATIAHSTEYPDLS